MPTTIQTMSCGCPEWECDLLRHNGCTVRETPNWERMMPRPRVINPFAITARIDANAPAKPRPMPRPDVFGPPILAAREQARRDKRTAEVTAQVAAGNDADAVLRTLRARLAPQPPLPTRQQPTDVPMPRTQPGDLSAPAQPTRDRLTCERMRVWQIAKAIGKPSAEVVQLLRAHGEWVANAQSTVVAIAATAFITANTKEA